MANMTKYKKQNDGYGYFAVFIDIFTQFLYTRAMKSLTGHEMVTVLEKNFKDHGINLIFLQVIKDLNM